MKIKLIGNDQFFHDLVLIFAVDFSFCSYSNLIRILIPWVEKGILNEKKKKMMNNLVFLEKKRFQI